MTILYLGAERGAADVASRALHGIAQSVTVAWSPTVQAALRWIQGNPDAAALIVGPDVQPLSCAALLEQVRAIRPTLPVVVVVETAQLERAVTLIGAAVGYVVAGPSLESELPRMLAATIDLERSRASLLARQLAELGTARDEAAQQLERADATRREDEHRRASELAAAETRLADVQAGYNATLAREARICTELQQRLLEAEDAVRKADERRASETVGFADRLTKRHAEFTAGLEQAARSRDALAAQLAAATAALDEVHRARRAEAAAAGEQIRRRDAEAAAALAEAFAARTTLENALAEAEAGHRDETQRLEADIAAANERQAALEDLLGQEADRRAMLDQELTAVQAAHDEAEARQATDLTKALTRLAEVQARYNAAQDERAAEAERVADREAELVERLASESGRRAALEADLAGTQAELAHGRLRLLNVVSAYRRRGRDQKARLETSQDQVQRLRSALDDARQAYESVRSTSDLEIQRLSAEYGELRASFEQLQAAFQTLEQIAGEHAAGRARLESVVADRDREIAAQAERHRIEEHAAREALARINQSFEASAADVARLNAELDRLRVQLDTARTRGETLRADARRVPDLEAQLEASQKEARRHFERAPYALCRCTPAGVITDANHAFVALVGRRRADDVRNLDFAAVVADYAGDLGWLFERMRARKSESIEADWKTRDGRGLTMRLHALATAAGSVEVVVEDITGYRALEERLRQGQRMEAVGRLASEVAATCEALLRDVLRDSRDWLAAAGSDGALRRREERLASELTRAASFLKHLAAYGDEQARALEPVSVQRVLRDLAPVLKRIVGDRIELVVSETSGSFDVDLDAGSLERILVNVAGFARERLPHGGQVGIELATTVVGRRFRARYPSVRPGPHVLITVTELPGADGAGRSAETGDRPGVDLGALVDLVGTCGGHVWMEAQPAGNLMLKIHLPKPAAGDERGRTGPGPRPEGGGRLARWFRPARVRRR